MSFDSTTAEDPLVMDVNEEEEGGSTEISENIPEESPAISQPSISTEMSNSISEEKVPEENIDSPEAPILEEINYETFPLIPENVQEEIKV